MLPLLYPDEVLRVAPFFWSKDPRVASRTDKFFSKALEHWLMSTTRTSVRNRKATALYWRFPPVPSPDRMDDTKDVKDHEGPEGSDADNMEDLAASRSILSEDEDASDNGASGPRNKA